MSWLGSLVLVHKGMPPLWGLPGDDPVYHSHVLSTSPLRHATELRQGSYMQPQGRKPSERHRKEEGEGPLMGGVVPLPYSRQPLLASPSNMARDKQGAAGEEL